MPAQPTPTMTFDLTAWFNCDSTEWRAVAEFSEEFPASAAAFAEAWRRRLGSGVSVAPVVAVFGERVR